MDALDTAELDDAADGPGTSVSARRPVSALPSSTIVPVSATEEEDFGEEFTPELREQERRIREQAEQNT